MTRNAILVVGLDEAFRRSLAEQFQFNKNLAVEECASASAAQELFRRRRFDLVIIDSVIKDMDGGELCMRIREHGQTMPVIMLADDDDDSSAIRCLDSGACDYIAKPLRLGVLLARVRAHLRQWDQSRNADFRFGPYTFRAACRMLVHDRNGRQVRLTDKEASILKFLHRAGNQAVTRDVLLGEVWGYNARVATHTLETHVYRLRQKIEEQPSKAVILVTEPRGYRLNS